MKNDAGLSLVELLVAATIMLMVFAMVYTVFIQTRKISLRNQMDVEILQNARIGLDEMARTIRMIGYHRDKDNGQVAIIEAAPFQLIFNADLDSKYNALTSIAVVKRYDVTEYSPPMKYTTGAETIRWTLDSNDDGIVDKLDTNDDEEERYTSRNPNDLVLIKEINGGNDQQITISVLGPFDSNDEPTSITPMFQYWLLGVNQSDDTPVYLLWGDYDSNGKLEGEEIYFPSLTSQLFLRYLHRIQITIITESNQPDPFDPAKHRRVTLSTEISLRNIPLE